MKEELETKYVTPSFSARLINNWHQHAQGNKSTKEYVEKFDEFLIRCSTLYKKGKTQILSRFRAGLRDDLRTELLVRGVNELETVYALVQDLDSTRTSHTSKSYDYRTSMPRRSPSFQPHKSNTQTPSPRDDIKGKSFERDNRHKGPDSSRVSSTTKCYICQGYRHLATNCPSLVKITIIDGTPTEVTESDSDEYTYHPDVETDDESSSDNIGLTALGQRRLPICLSSNMFSLHQQKRTIREELRFFTRLPRLETRAVR